MACPRNVAIWKPIGISNLLVQYSHAQIPHPDRSPENAPPCRRVEQLALWDKTRQAYPSLALDWIRDEDYPQPIAFFVSRPLLRLSDPSMALCTTHDLTISICSELSPLAVFSTEISISVIGF